MQKIKEKYKTGKSVEIPSQKDIYHKLISRLLKKSLHNIHSCNVVFSSKSDTLTDDSIKDAIKKARHWHGLMEIVIKRADMENIVQTSQIA